MSDKKRDRKRKMAAIVAIGLVLVMVGPLFIVLLAILFNN